MHNAIPINKKFKKCWSMMREWGHGCTYSVFIVCALLQKVCRNVFLTACALTASQGSCDHATESLLFGIFLFLRVPLFLVCRDLCRIRLGLGSLSRRVTMESGSVPWGWGHTHTTVKRFLTVSRPKRVCWTVTVLCFSTTNSALHHSLSPILFHVLDLRSFINCTFLLQLTW